MFKKKEFKCTSLQISDNAISAVKGRIYSLSMNQNTHQLYL